MRSALLLVLLGLVTSPVFPADDVLTFKAKVGFAQSEDRIIDHKFVDNDRKLVLIGARYLQVWDVAATRLISSAEHRIPQFSPKGFFSTYILLGLPHILSWRPYLIDKSGKWIITIERSTPDTERKSAVIRDLATAKEIAVLDVPNISLDLITYDESRNEIVTQGETNNVYALSSWEPDSFKPRQSISINDHKWHQLVRNDKKIIVGSGDTKHMWLLPDTRQGDRLTLRDARSGAVEKEFSANGFKPKTSFLDTTVSSDDRFLISRRDDRIIVWDIDGDGRPKFEISSNDPKADPKLVTVPGGRYLAVSVGKDLAVYELAGDGTPKYTLTSDIPAAAVRYADVSRDGQYIAVTDGASISVLATGGSGRPLYTIARQGEMERFGTPQFIEDGSFLVVTRTQRKVKNADKTEFYDTATGKLAFSIPVTMGSKPRFVGGRKYLYSENLGSTLLWNFADSRLVTITLKVRHPESDPNEPYSAPGEPYNIENTALSPDEKFILRYGDDRVTLFDIATGREVQSIFDKDKVKYDKANKVKKSGLSDAGWSADGRIVYAFEDAGYFGIRKTLSLWVRGD